MIEQIYCTHCTYGTSALEQREGELADRVLGYSARAGSEERNALRNDYRAIERFLYYYLPSDTPPEEKQRLDAAAAPRRLFFCPSMGRLQMVGQVAYRQYDTAGRLGSYFAHVLFADRSQGVWSPLDCLRLWDAPWVQEDSAEHPFALPSLERLEAIWAGAQPVVGDEALLRFLQSSAGLEDDGGRVIEPRWLTAPQEQRIDLLANSLQGLLALGSQRRENILLVVEPSVAALVFYGLARLLPKPIAEGLSFSTFEPNAERLPVTLSATTFFDPFSADVRSDLYRRRGLVINTYQDRISESGPPAGVYARFMIEHLLTDGWAAVEHLLESFEQAGAKRPEDLELLVPAHRAVSRVLSDVPPDDSSWRNSEISARYLAREVQHQLITAPAGWPQLKSVIGTPNHLAVLELVAVEGMSADLQRPAQFLLKKLPAEKLPELLASPLVARWAKLEAIVAQVVALGRLPDGCQLLTANGHKLRAAAGDRLLPDVLALLPEPVLRGVSSSLDEKERPAFFEALLAAGRLPSPSAAQLQRLLLELLGELSDADFWDVLERYRSELAKTFPLPQPALGERLGRLLYDLPNHPKSFEHRLSVLNQWRDYFHHPNLAERRLAEWAKVRTVLMGLREPDAPAVKSRFDRFNDRLKAPPQTDFKPLAEALNRAMPRRSPQLDELATVAQNGMLTIPQFRARLEMAAYNAGAPFTFPKDSSDNDSSSRQAATDSAADQARRRRDQQAQMSLMFRALEERLLVYDDDQTGSRKLAVLQQLGLVIVGRPNFLADGRRMIEAFFVNNGAWPSGTIFSGSRKKHGRKSAKSTSRSTMYAVASVATALIFVLLGYVLLGRGPSPSTSVADSAPPVRPSAQPLKPSKKPPGASTATKSTDHTDDGRASPAKKSVSRAPDDSKDSTASKQPAASSLSPRSSAPAVAEDSPLEETSENPKSSGTPERRPSPKSETAPMNKPAAADAAPATTDPTTTKSNTSGTDNAAETMPSKASDSIAGNGSEQSGPTLVDDATALPATGPHLSDHVWLKQWPAAPPTITLKLRGLEGANKALGGRGGLTQEYQSSRLTVGLTGTDGTSDSPTSLARFVVEPEGLSFQWTVLTSETRTVREAREAIRHCVLEVGGAEPSLLALAPPHSAPSLLPISNGRGTISRPNQTNPNDTTERLLLGGGDLLFQNGWRAGFDGPRGLQPYLLQPLPDDCNGADGEVKLVRAKNGQWQVTVGVRFDSGKTSDDLTMVSDHKQRRQFAEDLARLTLLDGNRGIRDQRPDQKDVASLLSRLAGNLGLNDGDLPALPEVDAKEEREQYKRDIVQKILRPAKRLSAQLAAYDWLQQHAEKVETVIYRQVETDLYARYLVYGKPDGVEPPETGQNGFSNEDE